jgi:RNA polymerase sigma factor (TIGR02999 family)
VFCRLLDPVMGERTGGLYQILKIFFGINWLANVGAPGTIQLDRVARLMASFRRGDQEAAGQLVELFYPELRRIAAARMRAERPGHTLQPTAVVHQLYLELVKVKALRPATADETNEKGAFLGLAAYLMKRLLIHHARPLSKRAGKAELPDLVGPNPSAQYSLVELDGILNRLAAIDPALRRVVELRVFEGLTREEIAREMGCGTATVARHWSFARNWLEEAFAGKPGS